MKSNSSCQLDKKRLCQWNSLDLIVISITKRTSNWSHFIERWWHFNALICSVQALTQRGEIKINGHNLKIK